MKFARVHSMNVLASVSCRCLMPSVLRSPGGLPPGHPVSRPARVRPRRCTARARSRSASLLRAGPGAAPPAVRPPLYLPRHQGSARSRHPIAGCTDISPRQLILECWSRLRVRRRVVKRIPDRCGASSPRSKRTAKMVGDSISIERLLDKSSVTHDNPSGSFGSFAARFPRDFRKHLHGFGIHVRSSGNVCCGLFFQP